MHSQTHRKKFPWYDSVWLEDFETAKSYIAAQAPERLDEFVQAFAPLTTRTDFQVQHLKGVLSPDLLNQIKQAIRALKPTDLERHEMRTFGRWVVHNNPILTELQSAITDLVAKHADEELEPSYNFLSLYTKLGRCPIHLDAPSAKWTLDICVDQSDIWPIHFSQIVSWPNEEDYAGEDWEERIKSDPRNIFQSFRLEPGEAILFSGSSQWHYRDPLASSSPKPFCHLLFFHFIPKGTRDLVKPRRWEKHFGIPGLSQAIQAARPALVES